MELRRAMVEEKVREVRAATVRAEANEKAKVKVKVKATRNASSSIPQTPRGCARTGQTASGNIRDSRRG